MGTNTVVPKQHHTLTASWLQTLLAGPQLIGGTLTRYGWLPRGLLCSDGTEASFPGFAYEELPEFEDSLL